MLLYLGIGVSGALAYGLLLRAALRIARAADDGEAPVPAPGEAPRSGS